MNFSVFTGIITILVIGSIIVFGSGGGVSTFLNKEGLLIVIGGTLAASFLIFPMKQLFGLARVFFKKILFNKKSKIEDVVKEIVNLAKGLRTQPEFLKTAVTGISDPFLRDGVELLNKKVIDILEIEEILENRAIVQHEKYEEESEVFKTLSRFPPAFGLMGTTLGMIHLMKSLGKENSFDLIGPAMGISLVATLYGIGVANLILIPFGERLNRLNREEQLLRAMIIKGVILLHKRTHPMIVEEHLLGYLSPGKRQGMVDNSLREVA